MVDQRFWYKFLSRLRGGLHCVYDCNTGFIFLSRLRGGLQQHVFPAGC